MADSLGSRLSRRERQVMDILFARGEASVQEIMDALPDPPTYNSVRSILRGLASKNLVDHDERGRAYFYRPRVAHARESRNALRHVMETFYQNSVESVMLALLEMKEGGLSTVDRERLARMIVDARKEGR